MYTLKGDRRSLCAVAVMFFMLMVAPYGCGNAPHDRFERIVPEEAGFSSEKLHELDDYLAEAGSSALMLIYDGNIFYEWGDIYRKHLVHSMRKALLNSLYGIYVEKGIIDTTAALEALGIDDIAPGLTDIEKSARIADLLKSRSGVYHPAAAESEGMETARPERGSAGPGERYYYNNWDFNVLGAVFEQLTGKSIYDAFHDDIARPLGMLQYEGGYTTIDISDAGAVIPRTDGFYQYERDKSRYPAYHFRMSAHDLALYGVLYANGGNWRGTRIVPEEWIVESTKPHSMVNADTGRAHGMLWVVETQYGAFQHTGAGVHMLRVYPDMKLVVVHRVDTERDYEFTPDDLGPMFGIIFGARVSDDGARAGSGQ